MLKRRFLSYFEVSQQNYEKLLQIKELRGVSVSQIVSSKIQSFDLQPMNSGPESPQKIKIYLTKEERKLLGRLARERETSLAAIINAIVDAEKAA